MPRIKPWAGWEARMQPLCNAEFFFCEISVGVEKVKFPDFIWTGMTRGKKSFRSKVRNFQTTTNIWRKRKLGANFFSVWIQFLFSPADNLFPYSVWNSFIFWQHSNPWPSLAKSCSWLARSFLGGTEPTVVGHDMNLIKLNFLADCFLKIVHSRPLCLFYLNVQLIDKILLMVGFEPGISGVRSNRFTNWATTTARL